MPKFHQRWILPIFLLAPLPAFADVVWPALYLETRLFSLWSIGLGLLIEFFFIWKVFSLSPSRAAIANIAANTASALLGAMLIPLAGMAWEVFPSLVFYHLFDLGTFNPITWCATFIMACLINAVLESYVLKRAFKLPFTRRTFLWLVLANALSVGVAMVSLWYMPVQG